MNENNKTTDRRAKTRQQISHMLDERKQLLSLMLQASKIQQIDPPQADRDLLEEFCQVLVDYIAAGHFGLYERIIEGTERRKNVADLAVRVYPEIEQTTNLALNFSEMYDAQAPGNNMQALLTELSTLGEALTTRIELEDSLIEELLNRR